MLICLRMAIPKISLLKSSRVQIGFPMPYEMVKNEVLAKAVSSINFIGNRSRVLSYFAVTRWHYGRATGQFLMPRHFMNSH